MIIKKKKKSYRPRVRIWGNSDSKKKELKKLQPMQKCLLAKLSARAKVSSCNFVRSWKFDSYPFNVSRYL